MKVLILLSILISFSIQSNCSDKIKNIINENSNYTFTELLSGERKNSRSITIRGSNQALENKKLASLEYEFTDDPNVIDIGLSFTNTKMRSLGLQTLLFRELMDRHPKVTRYNSLLVSTNEEVILRKIMENFIRADIKINQFRPSDSIEKQFESCCGDYFRSLSKDHQSNLVLEGLQSTPIYRIRNKVGLKLCSDNPYDMQTSTYDGEFSLILYVSFCL